MPTETKTPAPVLAPFRAGTQLGEYLVKHGAITPGELERGLAQQKSEIGRIANSSDDERQSYLMRVHLRATEAIEEANIAIDRLGAKK